ncbi:protein ALP1-like isoform X1 [Spinacia oleracea]|uniref:Protein ALP1-like isoform X1 n=1 Tax=Spinacia oleracea TaxID=3562 RepID=A0A9R0I320_SPIOL|nr:protein ALP1-like isoform X1 [Spinacia oleracea]
MARLGLSLKRRRELEFLQFVILMINIVVLVYMTLYSMKEALYDSQQLKGKKRMRRKLRLINLNKFIGESDALCRKHLRMDRFAFNKLCEMVRGIGGLRGTRHMTVEEIVAMFLYILAHHKTNRYVGAYFYRSGETVSRQFHLCLKAVLKLHFELLKKPSPITEECSDYKWKCFKNCVGAVDCTMVSVSVPPEDRSKYRTRKGSIAMNVLGACSPEMEFIYVLPGWEGSVDDGRVLRDAISRPNGLLVPKGCYYLCNVGYNGEGFLAPFKGHPYQLSEWINGPRQPQSTEENFNLRHTVARNAMKQCFGLLKGRWKILRSASWFNLKTHGRIVLACCLLHNFITRYMPPGSIYEDISDDENDDGDGGDVDEDDEVEYISSIDTSSPWTNFRNSLALSMLNS